MNRFNLFFFYAIIYMSMLEHRLFIGKTKENNSQNSWELFFLYYNNNVE